MKIEFNFESNNKLIGDNQTGISPKTISGLSIRGVNPAFLCEKRTKKSENFGLNLLQLLCLGKIAHL